MISRDYKEMRLRCLN